MLTRFRRVTETLIAGVAPDGSAHDGSAHDGSALDASDLAGAAAAQDAVRRARRRDGFGAMLADSDDPWDSTSWYERRKHALTLAVRSRERYGEVVEIGCSTGALTALLAGHADHVTALDGSAAALGVARSRGLSNVSWTYGEVPGDLSCLADHSTDLVVLSEIAYFLTGAEFLGLLRQARRLIRPRGEIVLVDWLAGSAELPLDGGLAHEQAATAYGDLDHRLSYRDDSIRLDAWGGVPIEPGGRP